MTYNPPTGPPLNWDNKNAGQGGPYGNEARGYAPQPQPNYNHQNYGGNNHSGPGGPPGGYFQQGPPPPQGGYYQQQPQQQYYVQQQPKKDNNSNCLMGCLAAMCLCCTLDAIF
ncbi:hypothetical protein METBISCDRAFT_28661 [Metschnikowia bicuspidata]|uniref:Cysteine-rich transmembrane domain-containing protein n=1 Tax=Metschnikowia bicuspidata TaxID=27322 RepID=A0A4P9Z8B2_9ASCO|nr:hypothetical protein METBISCDRAFT_28661 [Metschnikowia bicuspidata]